MTDRLETLENYGAIRTEIVALLNAARTASVRSVSALMTATYWEIGRRIVEFEQQGQERAEYGEALIKQLADDLTRQFGRGFGAVNLSQMRRFYLAWPPQQIFQTLSEKSLALPELAAKFPLPWSAYVRLLSVKAPDARAFYETEALRSGWSIRQLDRQIGSQFYERIALSKNKAAMLEGAGHAEPGDAITAEETVKDPFVLEFLGLRDEYSESDLEAALIHNLTDFLLAPVLKVSLETEPLRPQRVQEGMFVPQGPEPQRLEITLARLRKLVGEDRVGSAELIARHTTSTFRMVSFQPEGKPVTAHRHSTPKAVLRIYRPHMPARVQSAREAPTIIGFEGQRYRVLKAAGPWRRSGEWWTQDHRGRDEWDLVLTAQEEHKLLVKIYRNLFNGEWYVEGEYD
jgi:hypothetical protein